MHLGDSIFILILALVLLGPKKTAELAQQLGKLMGEFRKASNDFKFQFNEEMRVSEQQEQKRKQEEERAALDAGEAQAALPAETSGEENSILHASHGSTADRTADTAPTDPSEAVPYAISATTGDEQPVEDHPLLRVDVIPPMDGSPADQTAASAERPSEGPEPTPGPASGASEEQSEKHLRILGEERASEESGASVNHG